MDSGRAAFAFLAGVVLASGLGLVAINLRSAPTSPASSTPTSPAGSTVSPRPPSPSMSGSATGPPPAGGNCPATGGRRVEVTDAPGLEGALAAIRPGDVVHLVPGTYHGRFGSAVSGTTAAPIVVCGSRDAVLDGGEVDTGYGFHLEADYWVLQGFSVTHSQKGVVLDHANHDELRDLGIYGIGDEGIHLRACSSDNLVTDSDIHDVGKTDAHAGEGIYVGSAVDNWGTCSSGLPDKSDRNRVIGNRIGPDTTAESVDIKEGTTGTVVTGNTFDGRGMTAADSWVDAKGNDAVITGNTGTHAPRDGFQTHIIVTGWGQGNRFTGNNAKVSGPGYGFRIDGPDNFVGCDNVVTGAKSGIANVPCG